MTIHDPSASIARPDPAAPIVLTGRGGSGTRLFSLALQQMGVFLGNRVNHTEDSVEWLEAIYRVAVEKLRAGHAPADAVDVLRRCADAVLSSAAPAGTSVALAPRWGWKLPETILILPEVAQAFPACRIVQVIRHPLDTCLRRSHMTSRTGNPIGDAVLAAAYRQLGWTRNPEQDAAHLRNAASWHYQVAQAHAFFAAFPVSRGLTLRYESICDAPTATVAELARFLRASDAAVDLPVDEARRRQWVDGDPRARDVWAVCGPLARLYGYRFEGESAPAAAPSAGALDSR